jgi:hypothetical protein
MRDVNRVLKANQLTLDAFMKASRNIQIHIMCAQPYLTDKARRASVRIINFRLVPHEQTVRQVHQPEKQVAYVVLV